MKKLVILMMLGLWLLAGCTQSGENETENSVSTAPTAAQTESTVTETEPAKQGILVADSQIARDTAGAVQVYQAGTGSFSGIVSMGENLLMFTEEDGTVLTKLTGPDLVPGGKKKLNCHLNPEDPSFQVTEKDIVYYDHNQNSIIVLDEKLEETACFILPKDVAGAALLSPDHTMVYYTTESNVRVLDLKTGISRLLKETDLTGVQLCGIHDGGKVLELKGTRPDGEGIHAILKAENGETLHKQSTDEQLLIGESYYYMQDFDGTVRQLIFGKLGQSRWTLVPEEITYEAIPVPEKNGCLIISETEEGTVLSCYDLKSGRRFSSVTIPASLIPARYLVEQNGPRIFFSTAENPELVYGWNLDQTLTENEKNYVQPVYTADNPDKAGLKVCTEQAEQLGESYHINLKIWNDALRAEHTVAEYQVPAYRRDLKALEEALKKLPEGFLKDLAAGTDSRVLNVSLVRSVENAEAFGSLLYWDGGDAYLVLEMGPDIAKGFYHGLSHMIDNRVFGTCVLFDDWDDLNPEGFAYDNDYEKNLERDGTAYLQEDTRAFADTFSMSFAKEDRAQVFQYAMMENSEGVFASETMQKKLNLLCRGIREAFEFAELQQELPWEQYLTAPLFDAKQPGEN